MSLCIEAGPRTPQQSARRFIARKASTDPQVIALIASTVRKILRSRGIPSTVVGCRTVGFDANGRELTELISNHQANEEEAVSETLTALLSTPEEFDAAPDQFEFLEQLAKRAARKIQRVATHELPSDSHDDDSSEPAPSEDISLNSRCPGYRSAHAYEDQLIDLIDRERSAVEPESETAFEELVRLLGYEEDADFLWNYAANFRNRDAPASAADRARAYRLRKKLTALKKSQQI
jgi:hypothetical protein